MDDWNLTKDIIRDKENTDVLLVGSIKEFIKRFKSKCCVMDKNGLGFFLGFNECEFDELLGERFAVEKEDVE